MTTQNYLVVENNVVTNICVWDGDTNTWTPPADATMLIQADTQAKVWAYDKASNTYVLTEELGAGAIGFTWDGSVLTTNEPQPAPPKEQPVATGTTTA
jgi:hypothetical protein